MIIGIDVGLTGAVCVLENDGTFKAVWDMPVMQKVTQSARVKNQVNGSGLANQLRLLGLSKLKVFDGKVQKVSASIVAYVERVSTMPGQGIASNGSLMHSLGVVEGVLATLGIPVMMVAPQTWKKHFKLPKDKQAARGLAIRLVPAASEFLGRAKDIGRADAILIAMYGGQVHGR